MKSIKAIMVLLVATLLLTACKSDSGISTLERQKETENLTITESGLPKYEANIIIDREGNEIIIPENVETIISLAPSVTETLVSLGLAEKIIAIDIHSAEIEGLPADLSTFDMMSPDIESIIALNPDLVLSSSINRLGGDDPFRAVVDAGVFVTAIPTSASIEAIKEDVRFIGIITNTSQRAEEIVFEMEKVIDEITQTIALAKKGKKVYFEISPYPHLYSFGSGVFLNELIGLLGAENILADQESWVAVSEEVVLERNPDIIFTNVPYIEDSAGKILERNGWDVVDAVKEGRVYFVNQNTTSRSNEKVVIGLRQMAEAMYPELFL